MTDGKITDPIMEQPSQGTTSAAARQEESAPHHDIPASDAEGAPATGEKPARRPRRRRRASSASANSTTAETAEQSTGATEQAAVEVVVATENAPKSEESPAAESEAKPEKRRSRSRRKSKQSSEAATVTAAEQSTEPTTPTPAKEAKSTKEATKPAPEKRQAEKKQSEKKPAEKRQTEKKQPAKPLPRTYTVAPKYQSVLDKKGKESREKRTPKAPRKLPAWIAPFLRQVALLLLGVALTLGCAMGYLNWKLQREVGEVMQLVASELHDNGRAVEALHNTPDSLQSRPFTPRKGALELLRMTPAAVEVVEKGLLCEVMACYAALEEGIYAEEQQSLIERLTDLYPER